VSEKALRASTQCCTTYLLLLYLLTYHGTVDDAHELLGDGWVQRHDDDGVAWFGFGFGFGFRLGFGLVQELGLGLELG